MKSLKRFNQITEAKLEDALPSDYLSNIKRKEKSKYGMPTQQDMMVGMETARQIQEIQEDNLEELTQLGIELLLEHYPILNDINYDLKIVPVFDNEKRHMIDKSIDNDKELLKKAKSVEQTEEISDEIKKRKIINNLLQGEAQNVHSMVYSIKDKLDDIDPELVDLYFKGMEINKKFDWLDDHMKPPMDDRMRYMGSAMEIEYNEDEEGNVKPTLKVRANDLVMLIHETVKGIYELMAAHAIPDDANIAAKILSETDSLKDDGIAHINVVK